MSPRAAWRLESLGFNEVYDFVPGKDGWFAAGLPSEGTEAAVPRIGELVERDAPVCRLDESVDAVRARLENTTWDRCMVLNDEGVVLGMVGRKSLRENPGALVEDVMREGPSTYRPNVSVQEMLGRMRKYRLKAVPVTTNFGVFIGMVKRERLEPVAERGRKEKQ
jgi:CBS domain-containing protein